MGFKTNPICYGSLAGDDKNKSNYSVHPISRFPLRQDHRFYLKNLLLKPFQFNMQFAIKARK